MVELCCGKFCSNLYSSLNDPALGRSIAVRGASSVQLIASSNFLQQNSLHGVDSQELYFSNSSDRVTSEQYTFINLASQTQNLDDGLASAGQHFSARSVHAFTETEEKTDQNGELQIFTNGAGC